MGGPADAHLDTQSAVVHDLLTAIIDIVVAHSGHIHPDFVLVERDGALSAHCSAQDPGQILLAVPTQLLVPVAGARWEPDSDALRLRGEAAGLTGVQRELLDLHIDLYNACDKTASVASTHPKMIADERTIAAVQSVRPWFQPSKSPAETFIATRTLGVRQEDSSKIPCLMPVIDVLNHHPDGGAFRTRDGSMQVMLSQPNGSECYAHYGHNRDVLDLALQYGYLDTATPFVHCPALSLEVPGLGFLEIIGFGGRQTRDVKAPSVEVTDRGLACSFMLFQPTQQRWRVPLQMAVTATMRQRGATAETAKAAADAVPELLLDAAARSLQDLADAVDSTRPGESLVAQAARYQVAQLNELA